MSASDNFEQDLALLFFEATNWANVADNAASSPVTSWSLGAHTSDPGESGNQTTNETSYTSYARVTVARTSSGFDTTGGVSTLAALTSFPACTGSTATLTHLSLGNASSGTGRLQTSGTITPNISVSSGVTPQLTTATAWTIT